MSLHVKVDDKLIERARLIGRHPSDAATVAAALREYIARHRQGPDRTVAVDDSSPGLRPENQQVLAFLDDWMAEPDQLGDAWWTEFEAELTTDRFNITVSADE